MARPFRYTFILGLVAAGTALAAVGGWRYARASAPVSGPIILLSIDALRADRLALYGYAGGKTPALDALGADGVVFERAYSHVPQSLPAHASILSGRLPFETGVRDGVGFPVKDNERMLAEVLSDRGYATGAVVSSMALSRETGIAQGFASFDDDMGETGDGEPSDGALHTSVGPVLRDGESSERAAERWLQSAGTPRAFLFLHLAEPHAPHTPPSRFAEYDPYDGEVAHADEIVGRLVKYLKGHQLYDQSTIILVGDHGEGLGGHGEQAHGLFLYEEALRVPLIVKQAAGEGAGRRVADVAQHVDLMPTILDLAKAPVPNNLRGRSLKPLLDGSGRLASRLVYSESLLGRYHFGWSPLMSVTDGRHRFIRAPHDELYDLQKDPGERDNIVAAQPEKASALRNALDRLVRGVSIESSAAVRLEVRDRLEALGYAGPGDDFPASGGPGYDVERPDPKDGVAMLNAYRAAVDHDIRRQWPQAIQMFQSLLADHPASAGLWARLAAVADRADRLELAVDARARVVALAPEDPIALVAAASALLKARRLDEAHAQATRAIARMSSGGGPLVGSAREVLVRIALARHDAGGARAEAALALEAEPARPLPAFVDARLLQEQRRYDAALPFFEQALAELSRSAGRPMADLHFFAAETLVHLERPSEAEYQFLEELRAFPHSPRARAELALLYHAMDRTDEAARVLTDLIRITPTPEAYGLAVRAWTSFGNQRQAAAVRAEARRTLTAPSHPLASLAPAH